MRALDLKQEGRKQREIATVLGVSEAAVSQWNAAARRGAADPRRFGPIPGWDRSPG